MATVINNAAPEFKVAKLISVENGGVVVRYDSPLAIGLIAGLVLSKAGVRFAARLLSDDEAAPIIREAIQKECGGGI